MKSYRTTHNIVCKTVAISRNPVVDGMAAPWIAYDLTDELDTSFVLILRRLDYDFTSILESNGRQIEGVIDSSITPALYIDGDYIFDVSKAPVPKSHGVLANSDLIEFPVSTYHGESPIKICITKHGHRYSFKPFIIC